MRRHLWGCYTTEDFSSRAFSSSKRGRMKKGKDEFRTREESERTEEENSFVFPPFSRPLVFQTRSVRIQG
jgi:hypothetical protein